MTEHLKETRLDRLWHAVAAPGVEEGAETGCWPRRSGTGSGWQGWGGMIVRRTALLPRLKVSFRAPPSAP